MSTKVKVYSIEEANQVLPSLRSLLLELQEKRHTMMSMHDQLLTFELLQEKSADFYNSEEGREYLQFSSSLENLIVSFENDIQKITAFGCILRNIEKGIIEFYHVSSRELVFLNWVSEEEKIEFWRNLDSTLSERLPLSSLLR